jgi:hypothetical protein
MEAIDEALATNVVPVKTMADKPYTLADAIREGAMYSEQTTGAWHRNGMTCALGAAYDGLKARGLVD